MTIEKVVCPIITEHQKKESCGESNPQILIQIGQYEQPISIMCPYHTGEDKCNLDKGTCAYSKWKHLPQ